MTQSVAILGRQPALGLAELESLYGSRAVQPLSNATLLNIDPYKVTFSRLGGTVKLAKLLTYLPDTNWDNISRYLLDNLPNHLEYIPDGKIRLGLSAYGLRVGLRQINATGLELKRVVKAAGRSVRIVPNSASELNTAQVLHNQLAGSTGLELLLIADGERTLLAQTVYVQDINAYAARDQARPMRDARVGMLPPKLAQIIINLATDQSVSNNQPAIVLDPFCGTGVLLQEALLMGYYPYGTDVQRRMFEYSSENLKWLLEHFNTPRQDFRVSIADATQADWLPPIDAIASETYLGRPFSSTPHPAVLQAVMQDVDTIHKKFLQNLARQTEPGLRICLAVPAWKSKDGFKHLRILDHLEDLGYTRISFVHASNEGLIYHRPNQVVARELVVLIRS